MINKTIILLLPVLVSLFLTACAADSSLVKSTETPQTTAVTTVDTTAKDIVLKVDTPQQIANGTSFTLFKVHTTPIVAATLDNLVASSNFYYENTAEGEIFVDAIFDLSNLGEMALNSDDFMTAVAVGADGTIYRRALYTMETNGNTYVMQHTDLAPQSSGRFHCSISVPETETALQLRFTVNGTVYTFDYTMHTVARRAEVLRTVQTVEADQFAMLTVNRIDYTDDLLPRNTEGDYRHYPVGNADNTYLVVYFTMTNLQETPKVQESFLNIEASYVDYGVFTGMLVIESADGRGFSRREVLTPQEPTACYYLIEVPKAASECDVVLTIAFGGKEYIIYG